MTNCIIGRFRSLLLIWSLQTLESEIICSLQGVEFAAEVYVEFGAWLLA